MAIPFYLFVLIAVIAIANAGGVFVPPAELCLPSSHLKELTGCHTMVDTEEECDGKASEDEKLDCFCTQKMLSSYFDCESEIQRCLESHMFDSSFVVKVRDWHAACDGRLSTKSTTITTPAEPTLTTTYDFGACDRLHKSCNSAHYETSRCSTRYLHTSSMSFTSCACQPKVYSLISECVYNGNVSCLRTPAAESNIWGYSFCSNFWSGSQVAASVELTSFASVTGAPNLIQATTSSAIKPSPTGFITLTATETGRSGEPAMDINAREDL